MPVGINFAQQRPQMLVRKTPVKLALLAWSFLSCHATVYVFGAKLLGHGFPGPSPAVTSYNELSNPGPDPGLQLS